MQDFEWDPKKAKANARKHGITFIQATEVFVDEGAISIHDEDHSLDEQRFITIGKVDEEILVVSYTDRGDRTRIISARKATAKELRQYWSGR